MTGSTAISELIGFHQYNTGSQDNEHLKGVVKISSISWTTSAKEGQAGPRQAGEAKRHWRPLLRCRGGPGNLDPLCFQHLLFNRSVKNCNPHDPPTIDIRISFFRDRRSTASIGQISSSPFEQRDCVSFPLPSLMSICKPAHRPASRTSRLLCKVVAKKKNRSLTAERRPKPCRSLACST